MKYFAVKENENQSTFVPPPSSYRLYSDLIHDESTISAKEHSQINASKQVNTMDETNNVSGNYI